MENNDLLTSALDKYFGSEKYKLFLKSIIEESIAPFHNKIELRLEKLEKQISELTESNKKVELEKPKQDTPIFQLEIDFALKISNYQDFSKSFVVSPLTVVLGIYPFYKNADVKTREKIAEFILGTDNDEGHFIDLLGVKHNIIDRTNCDESKLFLWRMGTYAFDASIVNNFVSLKLNYLELEIISNRMDVSSEIGRENDITTILVNHLPFNIKWYFPFSGAFTFQGLFHSSPTSKREESFMKWPNGQHYYSEDEGFQMIQIRLENHHFFSIFLPKTRFGLTDSLQMIKAEKLYQLNKNVPKIHVDITIPKFEIDTEIELGKLIESIGIDRELYQKVRNFLWEDSTTNGNENSFVHRAEFEINEIGVNEPYRFYDLTGYRRDYHYVPMEFVADHPFIFMITNAEHVVHFGYYQ